MPQETQPAQNSELSQIGRSLFADLYAPTDGANTKASAYALSKTAAAALENLHYINGRWTNKDTGWQKHDTVFNSGAEFLEMGLHTLADGSRIFIQQVGNQVQRYNPLGNPAVESPTLLFTAGSSSLVPCMRSFSPSFFIYTNGFDQPQKYNGTTWTGLGAVENVGGDNLWPIVVGTGTYSKPKICEIFANRLCTALFENDPFNILISGFGNPEDYVTTGTSVLRAGVQTVPSSYGKIVGMKSFKLSNTDNDEVLLVGCEEGFWMVIGSDASTFAIRPLTSEFGALSNRCFIRIQNDLLLLDDSGGIRSFSSLVNNVNLPNANIAFRIKNFSNRINKAAAARAFAIHHPQTLDVLFWVPIDDEIRNRYAIVMNYDTDDTQPSGILTFRFSIKIMPQEDGTANKMRSQACGIEFGKRLWTGGYNGFLQEQYLSTMYDTEIIRFAYLSPIMNNGNPAQNNSAVMFNFLCDGGDQEFTATAFTLEMSRNNAIRRKLVRTEILKSLNVGSTALGTWILGTDAFPSDGPKILPFRPIGSGRYWQVQITGETSNSQVDFFGVEPILSVGGLKQ